MQSELEQYGKLGGGQALLRRAEQCDSKPSSATFGTDILAS